MISQDLTKCSPKGRDCIERNSARRFNCNTACEGIYAGIEWGEVIMNTEVDKKKYMKLLSEYKNFKKTNCRHFRFHSAANLTQFGEFQ